MTYAPISLMAARSMSRATKAQGFATGDLVRNACAGERIACYGTMARRWALVSERYLTISKEAARGGDHFIARRAAVAHVGAEKRRGRYLRVIERLQARA